MKKWRVKLKLGGLEMKNADWNRVGGGGYLVYLCPIGGVLEEGKQSNLRQGGRNRTVSPWLKDK